MQPTDARFVDQSLEALRLTLVEGNLDFGQFDVLQEDGLTLRNRGVAIQARIIGASHVISVLYGDRQFHEIVACVGVREDKGVHLSDLTGQKTARQFDGGCYSIATKTVSWGTEESAQLQALLGTVQSSPLVGGIALNQAFPVGNLPGIPRTIVVVPPPSSDDATIKIYTEHSYPGEGIVFTHTEFDMEVS